MTAVVKAARPGCQVDYNGQGVYGLGQRIPHMDNVDIEALPTAFWGYYYFPAMVRYARTFGITVPTSQALQAEERAPASASSTSGV